jgi:HPt (histidine-containing phosphotransfer) domain-containing protein
MDDYLTKPFTLERIRAAISSFVTAPLKEAPAAQNIAVATDKNMTHEAAVDQDSIFDEKAIANIIYVEKQTKKTILPEIFAGYTSQMDDKLEELAKHSRNADDVAIYQTAHAIKSMSANIGANQVRSISAKIEVAGRSDDILDISEEIKDLYNSYLIFVREFKLKYM